MISFMHNLSYFLGFNFVINFTCLIFYQSKNYINATAHYFNGK